MTEPVRPPTPEEIQAFVDGELSAEDADRVLAAITTDERAAAELDEALQVRALAHAMREEPARAPALDDLARARARRKRLLRIAIAAPLLAAALAAYCVAKRPPDPAGGGGDAVGAQVVAALAPDRGVLPRLAWSAADRHRPYDVDRAGSAAGAREPLSFELLARVEALRDPRALAAANVLIGNLERAGQVLEAAPDTADTWSDRAALALIAGDAERALLAADRALALAPAPAAPPHAPALWNRALALAALGLDRSAAASFELVAARAEPGWSDEAKRRAADLTGQRARREQAYLDALAATSALVAGGPPAPALAHAGRVPGLARLYLYDAIRAAPSAERVRELEPLARALDAQQGGDALARHVRGVAARPFARRAPLAARYRELVAGSLAGDGIAALIRELRAAGRDAEDLLLGALLFGGPAPGAIAAAELPEYAGLAEATGDPWFELLAAEQRALIALGDGDASRAESTLRAAAPRCAGAVAGAITYRCQRLARLQVQAYIAMHRGKPAHAAWLRSRRDARAGGTTPHEDELLRYAGMIASLRDDTGGSLSGLAAAYLEEWERSGAACEHTRDAREAVAQALINQHRLDDARAYLAAGRPCDLPFTRRQAFLRGQLVRPGDAAAVAALLRDVAALRADPATRPADRAFLDHVEGRALLGAEPERGRALLRRAIAEAGGDDPVDVRTRAYSYAVLVQDAGRRAAWGDALALLAEERGLRPPERCALGAAEEEAAVFVARGPGGELAGAFVPLAVGQPPGTIAVPPALRGLLEGCAVVDVIARQPYHGRAELLPPDTAARFRARSPAGAPDARAQRPAPTPGPTIVVGNLAPPAELQLAPLQPIAAPEGATLIEGAQATPERVLAAIRTAGFVELHGHGLAGIADDDAALLVLSPDPSGRYALTASEVARAGLEGRPVVVLAACEAASAGSSFHAAWGLADAFLDAGARAVIASPAPIRDADATRFFADVRARIQGGAAPAEALRDARAAWPDPASRRWLDPLVVFE